MVRGPMERQFPLSSPITTDDVEDEDGTISMGAQAQTRVQETQRHLFGANQSGTARKGSRQEKEQNEQKHKLAHEF